MVRSRITDISKGTSQDRVTKVEISSDGNYLALLDFSGTMKVYGTISELYSVDRVLNGAGRSNMINIFTRCK
jgi:hypothetical protein